MLRRGLTDYRASGAEVNMPYFLALLAQACEIEEGLTLLDNALQLAESTGERWFLAELNRHKGELMLRQRHSEAAEALFRTALGIAKAQKAKLWRLRAAMSFARLRHDQRRKAAGRDLLAAAYGDFTEGFDMPDLKEAKILLHELT